MRAKLYFVLVFMILAIGNSLAQDLIITTKGDSIPCKITKVKDPYIHFRFQHGSEIRNTLLALKDVQKHFFNVNGDVIPDKKEKEYRNYNNYRIAINGGFGYNTAKVSDELNGAMESYVKELKSGSQFDIDITYFYSEYMGFGMKYAQFNSSNSMSNVSGQSLSGDYFYGTLSDDIRVSFMAPKYSVRFLNPITKNAFLMSVAIGYMGYTNNASLGDNVEITGSTLGLSFDFGYDITLTNELSLGFELSMLSGTLSEFTFDDGVNKKTVDLDKDHRESLNRFDFSIGLRLNL